MSDFPVITLLDQKTDCVSMLATIDLATYLSLVGDAYEDQGGLAGQRAPIKTKTGMKIRARLVDDLRKGAVIPPVVIGSVVSSRGMAKLKRASSSKDLIAELRASSATLSIIDGMQRTTALLEASQTHKIRQSIRIEFWFAKKVEDLIYRMLVLNTGQVPWDLKRQLETLYKPIVEAIRKKLPQVKVISLDQGNRRSQAGEYRSTRIIELFMAYTSRSVDIDVKERVAEEFTKIDITEATSDDRFLPTFISALELMFKFDEEFSRLGKNAKDDDWEEGKVKSGRDLFTLLPPSVGFIVAVAELVLGSPGFDYSLPNAQSELKKIAKNADKLLTHMNKLDESRLAEFLDFPTLNQKLKAQSGRIGEYERNLYKAAFTTLLTKSEQVISQGSLAPCWLSYR